ncbi:hypothetical protein ABTZ58_26155, partial [Streptomyces sp. NPDC094143]|uniref:hypothetical protein n=1 Tax=Streptomyces sp. NPDC094143 TaxID=3155310 RepID=UPI003327221E
MSWNRRSSGAPAHRHAAPRAWRGDAVRDGGATGPGVGGPGGRGARAGTVILTDLRVGEIAAGDLLLRMDIS